VLLVTKMPEQSHPTSKDDALAKATVRAEALSYARRREALTAAANDQETALVVAPVESPLWFVNHEQSFVGSDPRKQTRFLELADEVIAWTNELSRKEQIASNGASTSANGTDSHHQLAENADDAPRTALASVGSSATLPSVLGVAEAAFTRLVARLFRHVAER
jgi:hypothetical protein